MKTASRFALSRRTLLRGAGAAVALPLLESMLDSNGTALAQGQPLPVRFGVFFFGNGVIRSKWIPSTEGEGYQLTPELAPLAPVREYVSVVSGYEVKTTRHMVHHSGAAGILSGAAIIPLPRDNADYSSKFSSPSIDQIAAQHIGRGVFPSLQLAVSKRASVDEGPCLRFISHKSPDEPLPPETNPAALFRRLFSNLAPKDPNDPRDVLRVSVLDLVKDDLTRVRSRLGRADAARFDAHLNGISELRQRLLALPPAITGTCNPLQAPGETNSDVEGRERLGPVSDAMAELLALAWACDLNRVASIQFSGAVARTIYSDLGQSEVNHVLSHDPNGQEQVHDAVVFVVKQFTRWLQRLKATGDGATNLLERSCILFTSDTAEGFSHAYEDHPILVAGRAGGALRAPGLHVRSAGGNASDVLLTCLRAVGVKVPSFGTEGGYSEQVCGPLLAAP